LPGKVTFRVDGAKHIEAVAGRMGSGGHLIAAELGREGISGKTIHRLSERAGDPAAAQFCVSKTRS